MISKLTYKYSTPKKLIKKRVLTGSSRLLLEVAEKYNIKWKIIPETQIIKLTY